MCYAGKHEERTCLHCIKGRKFYQVNPISFKLEIIITVYPVYSDSQARAVDSDRNQQFLHTLTGTLGTCSDFRGKLVRCYDVRIDRLIMVIKSITVDAGMYSRFF